MIYLKLLLTFLKIGAFTFGGGYAMLAFVKEEVLLNGWMEEADIINFIAISESTPGPFAINMSTYVGTQVAGFFGALCATLGVVLPSFVIILIVASCFEKFKNSKIVRGCMRGLKPSVVGLISSAALSIAVKVFFFNGVSMAAFSQPAIYVAAAIFAVCAVLAFKKVHPIAIIGISAFIGVFSGYIIGI